MAKRRRTDLQGVGVKKLLLTSDGLESSALKAELRRMLGSDPEKMHVWYIPTAALHDGWSLGSVQEQCESFKDEFRLGRLEMIDVEHVEGEALEAAIRNLGHVDVIYVEMGNTYALQYHLMKSGASRIIQEAVSHGTIFVGSSAGTIIAGQTIQIVLWKNWDVPPPSMCHLNWRDPKEAQGLNLAGGRSFLPHANGEYACKKWQASRATEVGHDGHEVIALADGEGFVIDGDRSYMITE
eukprot:TRINITY_DN53344_c0_g1_i1.p1 TRINITY_DN53344_c0_g1~~TRINITY_DN53344_c0_g1_i1.p1  ORF type:complete len:239 (-),score=47.24 TRINITY_DN53344_c0_g1_i1:6-722(-)